MHTLVISYSFSQENAEVAVKDMLKEIAMNTKANTGNTQLYAEDFMDDGSKIALRININEQLVNTSTFNKNNRIR